jgi:hypothetical protein
MNKSEVAALEKRISEEYKKKLEAIRLVQEMLSEQSVQSPEISAPSAQKAIPSLAINAGEDKYEEGEEISVIGAIRSLFAADEHKSWTVSTIETALRESKVPVKAKNPKTTINTSIMKLCKKGFIRVVRKGSGRIPNRYRFAGKKEEAGTGQ